MLFGFQITQREPRLAGVADLKVGSYVLSTHKEKGRWFRGTTALTCDCLVRLKPDTTTPASTRAGHDDLRLETCD